MPGVGPLTALAIEVFVPSMENFKSGRQNVQPGSWLDRMMERKPRMLVAVALANKMARAIWAMPTKKQDYREPVQAAVAYQSCGTEPSELGRGKVREVDD